MTAEIKTVGIAGAGGTMGAGIAVVAARAGFKTVVYDTNRDSLDASLDQTRGFFEKSVARRQACGRPVG